MNCDCVHVLVKFCPCFRQVLKICSNHQDAHTPPASGEEISGHLMLLLTPLKAADKPSDGRGVKTLLQTA